MCDLLWSDSEDVVDGWGLSPRGAGFLFGGNVVALFNQTNNIHYICRAHQLVMEGYKWMFNNQIATVWSGPNYYYRCGNVAAILELDENLNKQFRPHKGLDNLKDYAVRALVNAVDHMGTVAYKLTDLYEQQTTNVSTVDLMISCLNQRMLSCQTYMEKEGLRQQQITATPPRHHKHYILQSSVGQKMQNAQLDAGV